METNLKELYPTFIQELRHRHEVIWRVRQVYSAVILAVLGISVAIATPSLKQGIALTVMILGSLFAVGYTDWRYQKKKIKLLRQLDALTVDSIDVEVAREAFELVQRVGKQSQEDLLDALGRGSLLSHACQHYTPAHALAAVQATWGGAWLLGCGARDILAHEFRCWAPTRPPKHRPGLLGRAYGARGGHWDPRVVSANRKEVVL